VTESKNTSRESSKFTLQEGKKEKKKKKKGQEEGEILLGDETREEDKENTVRKAEVVIAPVLTPPTYKWTAAISTLIIVTVLALITCSVLMSVQIPSTSLLVREKYTRNVTVSENGTEIVQIFDSRGNLMPEGTHIDDFGY
jgi:hypothetical protein